MSKELAKSNDKEITKLGDFSTVEEAMKWASKVIDSNLLPNAITEPEQVMVIVQHGKELGISPHIALNNIHVIGGRPTLSSSMIGSLLKRRGIEWTWDHDYDKIIDEKGEAEMYTDEVANRRTTIHFYWKSKITERVMETTHSVTWVQMALAGYVDKDNWRKYPKEMMRARCLAYAVRALFPEVLSGFYSDLEINDVVGNDSVDVNLTEEGDLVLTSNEN